MALVLGIVTLGKRIEERRKQLGWSQNELARRAGVNHPTLYKIESGQRVDPSLSIVVRIARALGTSAEALLGLSHDETALVVDAEGSGASFIVRPLTSGRGESKGYEHALSFVTSALERAGAKVRAVTARAPGDAEASRSQAGHLAVGGLALVEELQAMRRRLDALEAWRRTQEGRARKRASR